MKAFDDSIIALISSDQKKIEITVKAAKASQLITTTLFSVEDNDEDDDDDDYDDDDDDKQQIVNTTKQQQQQQQQSSNSLEMDLPRVDSITLEKVVQFLIYFEQHPFPIMSERIGPTFDTNIEDEWYTKYMQELEGNGKNDMDLFYSVRTAANYMHITSLLEMTCLWLTFKIAAAKHAEPIRELLRLPRITQAEEEIARRQFAWAFTRDD